MLIIKNENKSIFEGAIPFKICTKFLNEGLFGLLI